MRCFLSTCRYACINKSAKAQGGPFTRFDPKSPLERENMSCLDYVIASIELEPYIESLIIDSEKNIHRYDPSQREIP